MDKTIDYLVAGEYQRQQHELELIASENYVSKGVMAAYANVFTNKYSEGYSGRRYYGGQKWVDKLERLCQWRALQIFNLGKKVDESKGREGNNIALSGDSFGRRVHDEPNIKTDEGYQQLKQELKDAKWSVNVQPLSGSPANIAVYIGCLKPGDTILGMELDAGGHLTHGHPLSASGVFRNIVSYGVVKETELLDYSLLRQQALKHKPKIILAGFSAYPRDIDRAEFESVADEVEKTHGYRPILMADIAHIAGLIAGGVTAGPFDSFDVVTTTTHKTLRGPRGGMIYIKKGTLKRNGSEINLVSSINRGLFPGLQGGPHEHIIAAKAVAFGEILYNHGQGGVDNKITGFDVSFASYTRKILDNAKVLSKSLKGLGWNLVSGGTDNHLILLDVTKKSGKETGIGGKIAEKTLENIGISVNKNMLPFDKRPPMDPSGLRLGTPAITTRGLLSDDVKKIAEFIDLALTHYDDEEFLVGLKKKVQSLCEHFPLWYDQ